MVLNQVSFQTEENPLVGDFVKRYTLRLDVCSKAYSDFRGNYEILKQLCETLEDSLKFIVREMEEEGISKDVLYFRKVMNKGAKLLSVESSAFSETSRGGGR